MARKSQEKALQQAALRAAEAAQQPTQFEPLVVMAGEKDLDTGTPQIVPSKVIALLKTHALTTSTNSLGDA